MTGPDLSRRQILRLGAAAGGIGAAGMLGGCSSAAAASEAMPCWQLEARGSQPAPNLVGIAPGDFLRYYNGGVLQDLTPYMSQEAIDDFYPEALATRMVDGHVYGLPMEQEPLAVFYDIPAFEKAGLAEGDIPTTWEEMLEIGVQLSDNTTAGLVLDTTPSYYQNFTFYPWLWQGEGDVVDPETQKAVFDSPAGVQALTMYRDAVDSGASPRTLPAGGDLVRAFTNVDAAMRQSG